MVRKVRGLAATSALMAIWVGSHCFGQSNPLPSPTPIPVAPRTVSSDPASIPSNSVTPFIAGQPGQQNVPSTSVPSGGVPFFSDPVSPPGPPSSPYLSPPLGLPPEDRNDSVLNGDPLLDAPYGVSPGFFGAVDVSLLVPHVKDRLSSPVIVGPQFVNTSGSSYFLAGALASPLQPGQSLVPVHLPMAQLNWTGSPRFTLGYRLPKAYGEVLLSYQFLTSQGQGDILDFDRAGNTAWLRSRVDLNTVDLDYGNREYVLGPQWDMKWQVGARLADIYFDSQAASSLLGERVSNSFLGAGPHVVLDLWRSLQFSGLSIFTRTEGSFIFGKIQQRYAESLLAIDGSTLSGETTATKIQLVPALNLQVGLGWTPAWAPSARFSTGYQLQYWWYLGNMTTVNESRADLMNQGVFFRGEWRF